jgi:hypothetical protein
VLTIACVFKTGGEYRADAVRALIAGVRANLTVEHRVVCLTDSEEDLGCGVVPLHHGWPGWWSKIELFRPGALPHGQKFYLDLDTIVVRNIDGLVDGHPFTLLKNFWADDRIGSGLMAWSADLSAIYDRFVEDAERHMAEYVTTEKWGDQGFIRFNSPITWERWQDRLPGKVVSFKRHCVPISRIPEDAAIVCFHGAPRPWQLNSFQKRWFANASSVHKKVELAGSRAQRSGLNLLPPGNRVRRPQVVR